MKTFLLVSLVFFLGSMAVAEDRVIPKNAKIFIEEMEEDMDGYLRAEIVKRKVPIKIVLSVEAADFIITGSATIQEKRSWHEGWLSPEKDHNIANIMVVDKEKNDMIWASEAGDRSWLWGRLRRGGPRKVAERLAKNLNNVIMKE